MRLRGTADRYMYGGLDYHIQSLPLTPPPPHTHTHTISYAFIRCGPTELIDGQQWNDNVDVLAHQFNAIRGHDSYTRIIGCNRVTDRPRIPVARHGKAGDKKEVEESSRSLSAEN